MQKPYIDLSKANHELERMNRGEIPFDLDSLEGLIGPDVDLTLSIDVRPMSDYPNRLKFKWLLIDTIAGPWFSLGFHIDFQRPCLDIHFIWWIITIGSYN